MIQTNTLVNTDSILFDLDGTLWDAAATCAKAWDETLRYLEMTGYELTEDKVRAFSGMKIESVLQKHFVDVPDDKLLHLLKIYRQNEIVFMRQYGGQLYAGVKETLEHLKRKYALFIISNCSAGYIENFIKFHDLQNVFTDWESSGNTGLTKAENISLLIERNKLVRPVYVGDTIWDGEAAAANHIPFIYAAYGFGKVTDFAYSAEVFTEIEKLLD